MSDRLWRPLRARLAGKPVLSIVTRNVSGALEIKLRQWLEEVLQEEVSAYDEHVQRRLAVRLNKAEALDDATYLYDETYLDSDELYDVIDATLDLGHGDEDVLQQLLDDGLSAYTIAPDGRGLVTRADPTAAAAVKESIDTAKSRDDAGSAGDHLAAAWRAAHAIGPDPVKAYSESIKAVEAAAHSLIQPSNSKATLGTMLKQMREHPDDYCLMIPAPGRQVEPAISMMTVLWQGQTSRHGGQTPTRSETIEEARAAVQLAVALVHWFSSGIIRHAATSSPQS